MVNDCRKKPFTFSCNLFDCAVALVAQVSDTRVATMQIILFMIYLGC